MIPFMMLVVRLQTAEESQTNNNDPKLSQASDDDQRDNDQNDNDQNDNDENGNDQKLFYANLRKALSAEDLGNWTLQVLQLYSLCAAFTHNFFSVSGFVCSLIKSNNGKT